MDASVSRRKVIEALAVSAMSAASYSVVGVGTPKVPPSVSIMSKLTLTEHPRQEIATTGG